MLYVAQYNSLFLNQCIFTDKYQLNSRSSKSLLKTSSENTEVSGGDMLLK